jgi:hypothetical protein
MGELRLLGDSKGKNKVLTRKIRVVLFRKICLNERVKTSVYENFALLIICLPRDVFY